MKEHEVWFERLIPLLKDRKLPCENGPARVCDVDEFMFMHSDARNGYFKHRDTRNYIQVRPTSMVGRDPTFAHPSPNGYDLFVPFTQDSFARGFFDKF